MTGPGDDTWPRVAELQGLYGPFAFPELLLQKLWWRREFALGAARTADGRRVGVVSTGRWNRLGGPDFREAVVELDGVRLRGDIEVHLRAEDWTAHRHAEDRAYDGVILHVVLFPPRAEASVGAAGRAIPILALLPLLWHDLEEYAADEAVSALLNRAEHRIAAELAPLPPDRLRRRLQEASQRRWRDKVRYARRRIERLGWTDACHQTALDILGYRSNRAGMLRVAGEWPLAAWASGAAEPDAVFTALRDTWALQGVRPANHPRLRLRQYATWVRACGDWPDRLRAWAGAQKPQSWPAGEDVATVRRRLGFPGAWTACARHVTADAIPSPRSDNLLGDGFLPLLTAAEAWPAEHGFAWWWHGYPGDLPDQVRRALRDLGLAGTRESPAAIGPAQGLLGWLLERELGNSPTVTDTPGPGA